jgi:hypothetical protein
MGEPRADRLEQRRELDVVREREANNSDISRRALILGFGRRCCECQLRMR